MVKWIRAEIVAIVPAVFGSLGLTSFAKDPECISAVAKIEPAQGSSGVRSVVSAFWERRPVESDLGQTVFFQSAETCNRFLTLFRRNFDGARKPAGQGAVEQRVADEKHKYDREKRDGD